MRWLIIIISGYWNEDFYFGIKKVIKYWNCESGLFFFLNLKIFEDVVEEFKSRWLRKCYFFF